MSYKNAFITMEKGWERRDRFNCSEFTLTFSFSSGRISFYEENTSPNDEDRVLLTISQTALVNNLEEDTSLDIGNCILNFRGYNILYEKAPAYNRALFFMWSKDTFILCIAYGDYQLYETGLRFPQKGYNLLKTVERIKFLIESGAIPVRFSQVLHKFDAEERSEVDDS